MYKRQVLVCAGLAYLQYSGHSLGLNLNDVKLVADLLSIALVHAVCLRLAHAPGALDVYKRQHLGLPPDLLGRRLDAGKLLLVIVPGQGHPAGKVPVSYTHLSSPPAFTAWE